MSDTQTAAPVVTTIKSTLLKKLSTAIVNVGKVEAESLQSVRLAGLSGLESTLVAYTNFAAALVDVAKLMGDASLAEVGGNAIHEYLVANVSEADWATYNLPKGSGSYVRTIQVLKWHNAAMYATYRDETENAGDINVYCPWLEANATGKFGNKSNWDVKKSLVDPTDWDETANAGKGGVKAGAKFGTLVKKSAPGRSGTPGSKSDVKVPDALAKLLKLDRDALKSVDHVADVAFADDETADKFALQIIADYLLRHNVPQVVAGAVTITMAPAK